MLKIYFSQYVVMENAKELLVLVNENERERERGREIGRDSDKERGSERGT